MVVVTVGKPFVVLVTLPPEGGDVIDVEVVPGFDITVVDELFTVEVVLEFEDDALIVAGGVGQPLPIPTTHK